MTKSPAFQFYPDDFLGSGKVGTMTAEEIGVFTLLLCLDWNETGFVFELADLARWCRMTRGKFAKCWDRVSRCFIERDGRMYNPRLELERVKQADWREKSAKGGRTSGKVRSKGGATVVEPPLANGSDLVATKREPNGNTPSPSPTLTTTATTSAPRESTSWLEPMRAKWEERNGAGSFASIAGQAAKVFGPLRKAGRSSEEIASRLGVYLTLNDMRFWNITKFAQTFDQWAMKPIVENGELTAFGERMTRPDIKASA